jgi:hypothetical protein
MLTLPLDCLGVYRDHSIFPAAAATGISGFCTWFAVVAATAAPKPAVATAPAAQKPFTQVATAPVAADDAASSAAAKKVCDSQWGTRKQQTGEHGYRLTSHSWLVASDADPHAVFSKTSQLKMSSLPPTGKGAFCALNGAAPINKQALACFSDCLVMENSEAAALLRGGHKSGDGSESSPDPGQSRLVCQTLASQSQHIRKTAQRSKSGTWFTW